MTFTVQFINIIMAGLIAGIVFGIWIGYNPKTFSVTTYIEQQQGAIRALNTLMPVLGLITGILTLISAFQQRDNKSVFITLLFAVAFIVISGLVTRFGNQPINSIVMTWDVNTPPSNWETLRDKWWSFHIVRTITSFMAFCLIAWANIRRG